MLASSPNRVFSREELMRRVWGYEASIDTVKYLFGPATPVARVKPGQIIEANTLDAFGNVLRNPRRHPHLQVLGLHVRRGNVLRRR